MLNREMVTTASTDAELVRGSLSGDREAFGQIVVRYQSLICSLAYSRTGSLGHSEDLAQETFVAAWKQLPGLREPEKLRSWLCRIVRNLTYDALREQNREPSHDAGPLDEVSETHAPGPLSVEQTISNEEAAILWRALSEIPELYREPLVLFYREHQSIETVAANLELSEDAVKQRLSRGRKLLQEQVLAFVEGALEKTSPGKTFTLAVLAAIPLTATTAKAATAGTTAAKAATGAKLGSLIYFLPVLGSLYFNYKSTVEHAKSPRERRFMTWIFWIQMALLLTLLLAFSGWVISNFPALDTKVCGLFLAAMLLVGWYASHRYQQIQTEDSARVKNMTSEQRREYTENWRRNSSKAAVYSNLSLACLLTISAGKLFWQVLHGDRGQFYFLVVICGIILLLCIKAWRRRPR